MMHKNYGNVFKWKWLCTQNRQQWHSKVQCPKSCLQGNIEQFTHKLRADCYRLRPLCHRKQWIYGLLCLFSFYYELWINILGKLFKYWKIFKTQKYIIRFITECKSRLMQRFKNLKILPLLSQYILSLHLLVVNNKNKLKLKSDVYNINTIYQP